MEPEWHYGYYMGAVGSVPTAKVSSRLRDRRSKGGSSVFHIFGSKETDFQFGKGVPAE